MNEIILYIGLGIFVIGGIGLLIAAFRTGIIWGLAVLFIAPVALVYLFVHWQDAKGPFKLQVVGILILVVFAYANDGVPSIFSENSRTYTPASSRISTPEVPEQQFRCDGRTHCSHMKSCAEAVYFIRNCPNTKMDGNNDGVPCERQWCK